MSNIPEVSVTLNIIEVNAISALLLTAPAISLEAEILLETIALKFLKAMDEAGLPA